MRQIEKLYVFVADDSPDEEGIMGQYRDGTWYPFVTSKQHVAELIYPHAVAIREITGKSFKVLELSCRTDVTAQFTGGVHAGTRPSDATGGEG